MQTPFVHGAKIKNFINKIKKYIEIIVKTIVTAVKVMLKFLSL